MSFLSVISKLIAFFVHRSSIRCLPVAFTFWKWCLHFLYFGFFHYIFGRWYYCDWWSGIYYEFFFCLVHSHFCCFCLLICWSSQFCKCWILIRRFLLQSLCSHSRLQSGSSVCIFFLICRLSRGGPFSRNYCKFAIVRDICVWSSSSVHFRHYTVSWFWIYSSVLSQIYPFFGSVLLLSLFLGWMCFRYFVFVVRLFVSVLFCHFDRFLSFRLFSLSLVSLRGFCPYLRSKILKWVIVRLL